MSRLVYHKFFKTYWGFWESGMQGKTWNQTLLERLFFDIQNLHQFLFNVFRTIKIEDSFSSIHCWTTVNFFSVIASSSSQSTSYPNFLPNLPLYNMINTLVITRFSLINFHKTYHGRTHDEKSRTHVTLDTKLCR